MSELAEYRTFAAAGLLALIAVIELAACTHADDAVDGGRVAGAGGEGGYGAAAGGAATGGADEGGRDGDTSDASAPRDGSSFDASELDGAGSSDEGDASLGSDASATDAGAPPDGADDVIGPPFVAVGYGTMRAYSEDGKTWSNAPDPTTLPPTWNGPPVSGDNQWLLRGVCHGDGRYIAVGGSGGDQGLMLGSSDGQSWTLLGGAQANSDCAYGNDVWVTSNRYSDDGVNWQMATTPAPSSRRIVFGKGLFVTVGDQGGGSVSYTTDGRNWTELPITYVGTDSNRLGYNTVAFGDSRFIAMNSGRADAPIFEWDGELDHAFTETPRPAELAGAMVYSINYGRDAFYISSFNALYRLADSSSTWEHLQGQGAKELYSLVITDERFVSDTYWSDDGIQWTLSPAAPADGVTKIIGTIR